MKYICIPVLCLSLFGCATLNTQAPTLKTVYEIRAAYDAVFLAPAANYRSLGICPNVPKPCTDPNILKKLQLVDKKVQVSLDNLEDFTRSHPGDIGVLGLYDAAILAVNEAQSFFKDSGIK